MRSRTRIARPSARERGVVLVISLLLLLMLTLIGMGGIRATILEERMTGNVEQSTVALHAAEAALRDAELFLRQPALPLFDGTNGLYPVRDYASLEPLRLSIDWSDASQVRQYAGLADAPNALSRASAAYFIEQIPATVVPAESLGSDTAANAIKHYRVTARGVGISGTAVVVLETTFRR